MSKNVSKIHVALMMIGEEGIRHHVLTKDFNTLMYDHTLHYGGKHSCPYCLQVFGTAKTLKVHVNDCIKTNGKQMIKTLNESEYVRLNNYESKIKPPFMLT